MNIQSFVMGLKTAVSVAWLFTLFFNFVLEPETMSKVSMFVKYGLLSILNIIFTYVIAYPLALVLPAFCDKDGWLPAWLKWFQTFDASIDSGWRDGYFGTYDTAPTGFALYWLRVRWLWRNPAYGFDYWPCGMVYDPDEWVVKVCDAVNGQLIRFYAETKDGKHFSYTDDAGTKLGWKVFWALDGSFHLMTYDQYQHVSNSKYGGGKKRLMLVFTP